MFRGDFQPGTLSEIAGIDGSGKTETIVELLSKKTSPLKIAWIESNCSLYPPALLQYKNIELKNVLFLETQTSFLALWAIQQLLRSGLFNIVVVSHITFSETELRRLQIQVEKSRSSCILLQSTTTHNAWPLYTQIYVERSAFKDLISIQVLKNKERKKWPYKLIQNKLRSG